MAFLSGASRETVTNSLQHGLLVYDFSDIDPLWEKGLTVDMFWKYLSSVTSYIRSVYILDDTTALVDVTPGNNQGLIPELLSAGGRIKWYGSTCTLTINYAKQIQPDYVKWIADLLVVGETDKLDSSCFYPNLNWKKENLNTKPTGTSTPKGNPSMNLDTIMRGIERVEDQQLQGLIQALITEDKRRKGQSVPPQPHLGGMGPNVGGNPSGGGGHGVGIGHEDPSIINPHHTVSYEELQKSLAAVSEGVLKAMMKEGVIRNDIPRLDHFSGKVEDGKVSFEHWEFQILALGATHSDKAIKEAMIRSAKGKAAEALRNMDPSCSWKTILNNLKTKYQIVATYDSLMAQFYQLKKGSESVSQFAITLEAKLNHIRAKHPVAMTPIVYFTTLRERFFKGLSLSLRASLRHKFDDPNQSYQNLLQAARIIEEEELRSETTEGEVSGTAKVDKPKVKGAAAVPSEVDSVARLEKAYQTSQNELKSVQKQLSDISLTLGKMQSKPKQPVSSFQQDNPNYSSPQSTSNQGPSYRGRGRGGYGRGRGQAPGQYQNNYTNNQGQYNQPQNPSQQGSGPSRSAGYHKLCYWCRDYLPAEQANHLIKECPYYGQGRSEWWSGQQIPSTKQGPSQNQGN